MTITYKQLGQSRPANTTAVSIYSPPASTQAIIKSIVICNTTASLANCRIFVDDDGTTYDETTAVVWDAPVQNNSSSLTVEVNICMNNSSGNLAVRTDTADALTFTAFGMEKT